MKKEFITKTRDGDKQVEAEETIPGVFLHRYLGDNTPKPPRGWTVSHHSGYALFSARLPKKAVIEIINEKMAGIPWDFEKKDTKKQREVREIISKIKEGYRIW